MTRDLRTIIESNPDGFSLSLTSGELGVPSTGYMVGLTNGQVQSLNEVPLLTQRLIRAADVLAVDPTALYLGGWRSDTGIYFLDLSVWIEEKNFALALGRLFRQQSLFECASFDCIPVVEQVEIASAQA